MFISWLFIILLGVIAIAAFSKRFWQFGLLASSAAIMAVVVTLQPSSTGVGALTVFWTVWTICLLIAVFSAGYKTGAKAAWFMAAFTLAILVFGGLVGVSPPPAAATQAINVKAEDNSVSTLVFADNKATGVNDAKASISNPLIGAETVNDTYATHSLKDSSAQLTSWTDLHNRVDGADAATQAEYISAFNARSGALGVNWDQVPLLMEAERAGVDTRVIQVINSTVSDAEARDLLRAELGDKVDRMEIVRVTGAVVTTNGGVGSNVVVTDWVDGRSTVQPFLTVPQGITTIAPASATANTRDALVSVGIDPDCANINTGVIVTPEPIKKPNPPTVPPVQPTTPPATVPPTTAPPTTAPPTTAPPTTTPPTTAPPTTAPPTTAPPTTAPPTTTPPTTAPPTTAPPTTAPPTTAPPTTAPPTTTPPTTAPPTTAPPTTLPPKDPDKSLPEPSGKPTDNPKPSGPPEVTKAPETNPAQPSVKPSSVATQTAPGVVTPKPDQPIPSKVPTGAPTEGTEIVDPGPPPAVVVSTPTVNPAQEAADKAAADAIAQQAIADEAAQKAAAKAAADKAVADQVAANQAAADKAAADKAAADAVIAKAAADKAALDAANEKAAQKAAEEAKQVASAPAEPAETIVPTMVSSDAATGSMLVLPFAGLLLGLRRKAKPVSKQRH